MTINNFGAKAICIYCNILTHKGAGTIYSKAMVTRRATIHIVTNLVGFYACLNIQTDFIY